MTRQMTAAKQTKPQVPLKDFYTIQDVAALIQVSENAVHDLEYRELATVWIVPRNSTKSCCIWPMACACFRKPVIKYLANVLHSDSYGGRAMKYSDLVKNGATNTEKQEFLVGGDMAAITIRIPENLRGELANYFDDSQDENIFDYVPPQKTNQIFTPRNVIVKMVNLFEQENPGRFDDPDHTFADLYMKSSLYITEVIKRLFNSEKMRELFPDDRARLDYILEKQVFGIAPTEIIYKIATNYILGTNGEVSGDCDTNFVKADSTELAKQGKFVEQTFGGKL